MTRPPSGTSACLRFISAIRAPANREKRSRNHCSMSGSRTRRTPATAAIASRVTSSRVGPPECLADRGGDPLLVVTHHGVPQAVPTDVGEPLADPGGVAVDDLTEQQLGADPDALAAHALLPLCSLVRP